MDLLPLEVLNKIADNRTLYLPAASSNVSVGRRSYFNQNWMWWQHGIEDTAEYLDTEVCKIGIDLLPLEVLNIIAENRTLYVLAASTTVRVGWRGSFNQNWMWWQHSNADTAEYLETAECRVEPKIESPESEDSTQTCLYKKAGDKEISIKKSLKCNADAAEDLETAERRVDPRFEFPESEESTQTCLYKKVGDKEIFIIRGNHCRNSNGLTRTRITKYNRRESDSTVSVGWRGSFNQNWMWWQHCNADTAEYVETAECRVEPRFESPESEDSTLTYLYKRAGDNEMSLKRIFVEIGMDLLPLEALNIIAENRTLYVLAASSNVNVGWRGFFKQNWMWWPQCNADTAEYLETAESRVDLRFESPESEESTQTCLYKKARDKEIYIKESLTKYNHRESDTIRPSSVFYRYCGLERFLQLELNVVATFTWELRSVRWSRVLSLRSRKTARRLVYIRELGIKKSLKRIFVVTEMDLLPLEVLNKIAENRTLYVLAASSTVNCNADTAEYLETAECRVDPRFESQESEDSTQTCLYKKVGDKEIFIIRGNHCSVGRRGFFNQKWMWWEHCNADTAEYVETAECRVEPRFESPENRNGLTLLEVLNKIAEYRTLYVLVASSTVSDGWRGSFNQNWMWWQHCIAGTAEYVETAECRVELRFESPESEETTQTCLYKKAGDNELPKKITVVNEMDLLPLEVLNKIAENRILYVLAASSNVNVGLRGSFNQNWMWWPQCNADTAEYLETAECRVDPRFESQDSEDSTQTKTVLDLLALELLNIFAENQTLYVLAASSTVSVGWRGSFNQKWMWWQHCNADTAEYVDTAECRVEPRFEPKESEDTR
ncbi:hypothetical protein J6590_106508 [Homalodisca vitripennis]|nr:hypothetical protein J6590_106508 [Homalodisca vitripennis]